MALDKGTDHPWVWIGGYRELDGSQNLEPDGSWNWKWVDGSNWTYVNWEASQPENYFKNESVIALNPQGEWNDGPVGGHNAWKIYFVCVY